MDPLRAHLLEARRGWVERALDAADAVAAGWTGDATSDREQVVGPYRAALERAGVLAAAPDVLASCVRADGLALPAEPVAAPPYVVVTAEGLLLRATLDDGRLLVRVAPFVVERDPVRYRRGPTTPGEAVHVARRTSSS